MKRSLFFVLAGFALSPMLSGGLTTASAAEIKVVSAVPVGPGIERLAEQYKRASGHDVKVQVANTGEINKLLASSEPFDILVGTTAMVDQAAKDGKAAAATRMPAGRIGIGVIVQAGAAAPNVATVDALKRALLAADSVIYNRAGSGQNVEKMIEQMGLAEQLKSKIPATRPGNAAETMESVIRGKGSVIGFGLISEIKTYESKGIKLAGPLPAGVQNYTTYDAVVMSGSKSSEAARDFIRYLATPAARQVFASTGVD